MYQGIPAGVIQAGRMSALWVYQGIPARGLTEHTGDSGKTYECSMSVPGDSSRGDSGRTYECSMGVPGDCRRGLTKHTGD